MPNRIEAQLIANEIEQFMYDRGKYDFHHEDRIRWLISDSRKGNARHIGITSRSYIPLIRSRQGQGGNYDVHS